MLSGTGVSSVWRPSRSTLTSYVLRTSSGGRKRHAHTVSFRERKDVNGNMRLEQRLDDDRIAIVAAPAARNQAMRSRIDSGVSSHTDESRP